MRSINFRTLTIENFLSVGDVPVIVDFQKGITLVTGFNNDEESRNGIGKSTIFVDAIHFALFGSVPRGISNSNVINRQTKGTSGVRLVLDITDIEGPCEYVITRTLSPSTLTVLKNGVDVSININKSTTEISRLIGCGPEIFSNAVVTSINGTIPFMAQSKPVKRKFIEGIFKLEIFSSMLNAARAEFNNASHELALVTNTIDEKTKTLSTLQEQKVKAIEKKKEQIRSLQLAKDVYELKIIELQKALDEIGEIEEDAVTLGKIAKAKELLRILKGKKDALDKTKRSIESDIESLARTNSRLKDPKNKTCTTCKRDYDDTHKTHIEESIQSNLRAIEEKDKELAGTIASISEVESQYNQIDGVLKKLEESTLESKKKQLDKAHLIRQISDTNILLNGVVKQIGYWESSQTDFDSTISALEQELEIATLQQGDKKESLRVWDYVKFISGEEGVKSMVINKMISVFNARVQHYLEKMNTNCTCTFDSYFDEKFLDRTGNPCDYGNFSAGEKKRIDIALLFAFQDIRRMQGDVKINLVVYDELFDSSLDQTGIDAVMSLLKDHIATHDDCVYIITHRTVDNAEYNKIEVYKTNGITHL